MLKILSNIFLWILSILVFIKLIYVIENHSSCPQAPYITEETNIDIGASQIRAPKIKRTYSYNRQLPLIFVAGIPASGLELMRLFLNQNPLIRCGRETEIISDLIYRRHEWVHSKIERERLRHAGMTSDLIDDSVSAFILETLLKHDKIADFLCNKDPDIFLYARYIKKIFPNVKFILMVRDPLSTVDSLLRKGAHFSRIHFLNNFEEGLSTWNKIMDDYIKDCRFLGENVCKIVFYEKLILNTNKTVADVEKFLNVDKPYKKLFKNLTDINLNPIQINKRQLFKWQRRMSSKLWNMLNDIVSNIRQFGYDYTERLPLYSIYDNLTFTF
ncbi:hypothetical protein BpHYR1_032178 [Brachionus plicatilis]|uniref:Protein-tyrosine sulfotransferase n=1 Tax=Brachionus plicatilis TaxID=10195 RepID=A0A3M7QQW1_BRAPC|nr:hypothetical protein BpHYR1_032178 [Brachionus plicatilis]